MPRLYKPYTIGGLLTVVLLVRPGLIAQEQPTIEDNSYFIEEAYNQEEGVVQHISNGLYFRKPQRDFVYSFTQEWPLFVPEHQISFTISYSILNSRTVSGVGDIVINYRYQLSTRDHWAAVAPRMSVVLPTGSKSEGLGLGSLGLQFNIPVSKRLAGSFIAHFNAGLTVVPIAHGSDSFGGRVERSLLLYNLGASVIWLAKSNFNLMAEFVENFDSEIDENGGVVRFNETIVSPGFRYAIDIGELQIVPGIAVPLTTTDGRTYVGTFFYLSFEHPF